MRVKINVGNGNSPSSFPLPHTSRQYCISILNLALLEAFAANSCKF